MFYLRLTFAFLYYLLRPKTHHHSPVFFIIVFVLALALVGLFFRTYFFPALTSPQSSFVLLENLSPNETSQNEIEREKLQKKQSLVQELLKQYPTSRDLWLYNGWIALSLADNTTITKTTEMLKIIDPNNPQVLYFFDQL